MTKVGARCDRCGSSMVRMYWPDMERCAHCGRSREMPSPTPIIDSAVRSFIAREDARKNAQAVGKAIREIEE